MSTTLKMKISGSGIARNGMEAIKARKGLYDAKAAISCLHDALLAVARGDLAPEEVKAFFWSNGFDDARYYGDVVTFEAGQNQHAPTDYPARQLTDQELADWVPKNFTPKDGADQASRAAGISARVLSVIRGVRAEYERPPSDGGHAAEQKLIVGQERQAS